MTDPISGVVQDGLPVSKSAFRSYENSRNAVIFADAAAVRAADLTSVTLIYVQALQTFFERDSSNTTSDDNGSTVIVDDNGNRWVAVAGDSPTLVVAHVVDVDSGSDPATDYEAGDTIDGQVLQAGWTVLRAVSTLSPETRELNGLYRVPSSGAASRLLGFTVYDTFPGALVSIILGTAYASTLWKCTSDPGGTIDSTPLLFDRQFLEVLNDLPANTMLGRASDSVGGAEQLTPSQALNILASGGNPVTGLKNKVINGGADIWQNGTVFNNIASGDFLADRWEHFRNGSGATVNISRQEFAPGQNDVPGNPSYYIRFDQTVAGSGATNTSILTDVESVETLAGLKVTYSFWARVNVGSVNVIGQIIQLFGSGGSPTPSNAVFHTPINETLTSEWAKYEGTVTLTSVSGKTIGTNGDDSLRVQISFSLNQIQQIDVARVSVVRGDWTNMDNVDPFEDRMPGDELRLCQRYNQYLPGIGFSGVCNNTTTINVTRPLIVPMRTAPSVVLQFSTPSVQTTGAFTGSSSSLTFSASTESSVRAVIDGFTGLTAGQGCVGTNTSNWLRLRAEI